jgi:hypothetical protein
MDDRPPTIIFSDDSAGYRAAVRLHFPESYHRGCAFHVIRSFANEFRKFKSTEDVTEAEYLVRKVISTVDTIESGNSWGRLRELILNHGDDNSESFLAYYERPGNFEFWTICGLPRTLYIGSIWSNSPAESVNTKIKRSHAHENPSLLRTIFSLCALFDDQVQFPAHLQPKPEVKSTTKYGSSKTIRNANVEALESVTRKLFWKDVRKYGTIKCIKALAYSGAQSSR